MRDGNRVMVRVTVMTWVRVGARVRLYFAIVFAPFFAIFT